MAGKRSKKEKAAWGNEMLQGLNNLHFTSDKRVVGECSKNKQKNY
jgi:hypothetical protein